MIKDAVNLKFVAIFTKKPLIRNALKYHTLIEQLMGIIFDLDGTLSDSLYFHSKFIKKVLDKELGANKVKLDVIKRHIRVPLNRFFPYLSIRYGLDLSAEECSRIMQLKDSYITPADVKRVKLFPGVLKLIKLLKHDAIKIAIATSMNSKELSMFIPSLKLHGISRTIINSPSFLKDKPNPYIINTAIKLTGMNKGRTVYIGDSIYDAEAAWRARVKFIGIHNPELAASSLFFRDEYSLYHYIKKHINAFRD